MNEEHSKGPRNASIFLLIGDKIAAGSDEEKAITKALAVAFPNPLRFLCRRPLRQNVTKHLENKVGATRIQRNRIVHDLFGDEGNANGHMTFSFEEKVNGTNNFCESINKVFRHVTDWKKL